MDRKQSSELAVAEIFCAWYAREHGVSATVARATTPPSPDVELQVDGSVVAMELAQYREQGYHNAMQSLDRDLKLALLEQFRAFGRNRLPRCTPHLRYHEPTPGRYTIPQPDKWPQVGSELIALLRRRKKPRGKSFVQVRFSPAAKLTALARHDRLRQHVADTEFPTLSQYCTGVDVSWHPELGIGLPATSMSARFSQIDFAHIDSTIRQKLANVAGYRRATGEMPLWLLYYTEGTTATGRLSGRDARRRVAAHLRSLVPGQEQCFDAIWWADNVYAPGGPAVLRIL